MYSNYPRTQNSSIFSVSEISGLIKNTVEDSFSQVQIKGEISGLKIHSSGHIYFSLKDEYALINSVCFKNYAKLLKIQLEDGLEVILTGKITTYTARSNYQILVSKVELAGQGALMELYEKRKKALAAEGLFSSIHKKAIPKIPRKIAIITSETGAVFHDICHRITDRFPLDVMLYPSNVQGRGAEINLANAIAHLNEISDKADLIILARGGGSIEDLWCFNEEILVRAIFNSKIPIISAIGHETDTTLADYAADLRAPTPSAAAELATPDKNEIKQNLDNVEVRLKRALFILTDNLEQRLKYINILHPKESLKNKAHELNNLHNKLRYLFTQNINYIEQKLVRLRLGKDKLSANLKYQQNYLNNYSKSFTQAQNNLIESKTSKLQYISKLLESYSYKKTLARGFSVVRTAKGEVISSKENLSYPLNIEFKDGTVKIK
ncbi:MAG: exodeoxyribonuclease VII large subunit [Alphaproteobacteria bacterium]|jgi:exodeoxyribonuclease VII large subunit|nr:exodeoxyribonuclease VII large subunit [Alphaproteobacteria bacterium]